MKPLTPEQWKPLKQLLMLIIGRVAGGSSWDALSDLVDEFEELNVGPVDKPTRIKHDGGLMPVHGETVVKVYWRDDSFPAGDTGYAISFYWAWRDHSADIIEYEIVEEHKPVIIGFDPGKGEDYSPMHYNQNTHFLVPLELSDDELRMVCEVFDDRPSHVDKFHRAFKQVFKKD